MSLGEHLKRTRIAQGMTQAAAAASRRISKQAWSARERGVTEVTAGDFAALGVAAPDGTPPTPYHAGRPGRIGRMPDLIAGMSVAHIAQSIIGEIHGRPPSASEYRVIMNGVTGATDLGIVRLDALLRAYPEVDARKLVHELAQRVLSRGRPVTRRLYSGGMVRGAS